MPGLRLSARAQADVVRLHRFLLHKDANAARRAVAAIRDALQPLEKVPAIGRPVEDAPEMRELVIDFGASGYLALYRHEPKEDAVVVLAIKHQRENDYQ